MAIQAMLVWLFGIVLWTFAWILRQYQRLDEWCDVYLNQWESQNDFKVSRQDESQKRFSAKHSLGRKRRRRPHRGLSDDTPTVIQDTSLKSKSPCKMPEMSRKITFKSDDMLFDTLEESKEKNETVGSNGKDKDNHRKGVTKRCTIRTDFDGNKYAVPLESAFPSEEILISTNTQRRTALDGDIVLVEIIEDADLLSMDNEQVLHKDDRKIYGRVIQVEKRALDMADKEIICFPDRYTNSLMIPLDRTLPKIFIQKEDVCNRNNGNKLTISIYNFKTGIAVHDRNVSVTRKERPNKLFVVRWHIWDERYFYPSGWVVDVLPPNTNEEAGLDILKRVYNIPEKLDNRNVMVSDDWCIPPEELLRRKDCRDDYTITIDPENTLDFDDALSISKRSDRDYNISIHIADVSYFVKRDNQVDMEARVRATSHYPNNSDPIHMLPPILSTNLCSFHKNKDRLAVSLFVVMDENGNVAEDMDPTFLHTVISCKAQLTYNEAEEIIKGNGSSKESTHESVVSLHNLAKQLRQKRLGSSRLALNIDGDSADTPEAHMLVEEMMIFANQLVARFLMRKFHNNVPLRRQLPPEAKKLCDWYDVHKQTISNSIYLLSEMDFIAKILGIELLNLRDTSLDHGNATETIDIQRTLWTKLRIAGFDNTCEVGNSALIICSDQNHPHLVPALSAFRRIMRKAEYVCSGEHQNRKLGHTALHLDFYTHFTSPIRRYMDIIVHRILKAALVDEKPPYGIREISQISHHCNSLSTRAREFQLKTNALQLAVQVTQEPITVHSVIESVSEKNMMAAFSFYPLITPAYRRSDVAFNLLKPICRPEVGAEKKCAIVKWKERIFHILTTSQLSKEDIKGNRSKQVELNTNRFVVKLSASRWMAMQKSAISGDTAGLRQQIQREDEEQQRLQLETFETTNENKMRKQKQARYPQVEEATCELGRRAIDQKRHHYVDFKKRFTPGDVLQVQIHGSLYRGMLTPKISLVNVTPMIDFCVEHRQDAVQCFAQIVDRQPSRKDINTYQTTWCPIIEMMTSYSSVHGNENVIIHGVQIEWQDSVKDALPRGFISLPFRFCAARHIKISSPNESRMRYDYLCIRYRGSEDRMSCTDYPEKLQYGKSAFTNKCQETTFVAHAYITDTIEQDDFLTAVFEVHHCSSPFPVQLLRNRSEAASRYTVEIISKPVPDRRLEKAVSEVHKAPKLIQDICLLKVPKEADIADRQGLVEDWDDLEIQGSPFPSLNVSQKRALRRAISQPFTVIQGPPGTGKTVTGACLVYFFTKKNSTLRDTGRGRPQILYCGPSNKSVDVIADYLKQFWPHHKLSMLRVYSKSMEYKDFPPPGVPGPKRKMDSEDVKMDPGHQDIALHFRIRKRTNRYAEVIRTFETTFHQKTGRIPSDEDFSRYKRNVTFAEREELQKHQVILCTCNTAGQYNIRQYTNIIQCIVDEAGMCSEPETLIPLVNTKPKQIVLVGDHKQLRPIIQEETAQQLGMGVSLLERYSKDMEMLDTQYRMHTAICEFPSNSFYNGRLKTAKTVTPLRACTQLLSRWPGGEHQPTVFCHTIGREETLSVHTEEGNEMSKANMQEVYQVARIARTLFNTINCHRTKPMKIVILTQYQLQRKKIEIALKSHHLSSVIDVRTVIKSQGSEWDFVIISTVRSLPRVEIEENPTYGWKKHHLGFIADDNQMNVALTRAKRGLIIVGNMYLLKTDKRWKELLHYYERKKCVVAARDFLPPPAKK